MNRYRPPVNPWEPPDLTPPELLALRALVAGKASASQQIMALSTIVTKFSATYDMSFRPGEDGALTTAFAEGKRFVGQRILEATTRPLPPEPKKEGASDARTSPNPASNARRNPKPEAGAKS